MLATRNPGLDPEGFYSRISESSYFRNYNAPATWTRLAMEEYFYEWL